MISVFTPSHDSRYLDQAYLALDAQTYQDWEWVVLLNGNATWECADSRVRVRRSTETKIGSLKREAVSLCSSNYLVELDHDDLLTSTALSHVYDVLAGGAEFCYSDWAQITEDGLADHQEPWSAAHGWLYYSAWVDDIKRTVIRAQEATPRNLSRIWWAPNHLRAFTRRLYDRAGGYQPLAILDDQDLMCRMYWHAEFAHIRSCLYLQRLHTSQTQMRADLNAQIQIRTVEVGDYYLPLLVQAWRDRTETI